MGLLVRVDSIQNLFLNLCINIVLPLKEVLNKNINHICNLLGTYSMRGTLSPKLQNGIIQKEHPSERWESSWWNSMKKSLTCL